MSTQDNFIFQETRARLGSGSGIYVLDNALGGKFKLFLPTQQVPFTSKETGEVEIKVVNADVVGKLKGIDTLNAGETDFYLHRDTIKIVEAADGQTYEFLSLLSDFSAYRYTATVSYSASNTEMDAAIVGTLTLTPKTKPVFVANALPLLIPTLSFVSDIPPIVELATTTGKYEQEIELKEADGTYTATSENQEIATAQVSEKKLTITGVAEGSTIVTLKSSKTGFAPWETTILVVVPKSAGVGG